MLTQVIGPAESVMQVIFHMLELALQICDCFACASMSRSDFLQRETSTIFLLTSTVRVLVSLFVMSDLLLLFEKHLCSASP